MSPSAVNPPGARRPSWATVYATGVPFLRNVLNLLGVAESDLDDVLQDVLLAAYRALERYDEGRYARAPAGPEPPGEEGAGGAGLRRRQASNPLFAWLFGIAWRQVSHYRERAHRRREIPVGLHMSPTLARADDRPSPEQSAMIAESIEIMSGLLGRMDLQRRTILVLHDLLEVSISDIARELGVNRNTVQNRLRLAREDFRATVTRLGPEKRRALRAPGVAPPGAGSPARVAPGKARARGRGLPRGTKAKS